MALKCAVKYCKPGQLCGVCEASLIASLKYAHCEEAKINSPELYPENLDTLKHIMARIPTLANLDGVYEIEVRVRMENVDTWAIIGYGEAGDPCLLRFDPK
jgi:hypothetical protein